MLYLPMVIGYNFIIQPYKTSTMSNQDKLQSLEDNSRTLGFLSVFFDFSVYDAKDSLLIKKGLEFIQELTQTYIAFENGFNPDNS